ncbi:hypothetical protein DNAM5_186 [Bacillus phage Vinny]|uniref:Uncharacterized protein n=1 Tax=Bacillus phage Vinny TaxID=1805955 RepID=A0A143FI95_9CAUD|nr:hypothetical protein DNAM5_186 [Bacillus phage Vinny]
MFGLDLEWLSERFIKGNAANTEVGDKVYIKGLDGFDEVMFPHIVHAVVARDISSGGQDAIYTMEDNKQEYIPPSERGMCKITSWYKKKPFDNTVPME